MHSIYNSLHLLIPNSQSMPPPPPRAWPPQVCSVSVSLFSVSWISSLVSYFRLHIEVVSYGICLSLSNSFTQYDNLQLHPRCCQWHYFIPFYRYFALYMYCIFCIPSSVDGHLGCFHVLAIGNSDVLNVGMHVSF